MFQSGNACVDVGARDRAGWETPTSGERCVAAAPPAATDAADFKAIVGVAGRPRWPADHAIARNTAVPALTTNRPLRRITSAPVPPCRSRLPAADPGYVLSPAP